MKILCGIDEAGYGPPLGPLVISAAIFETDRQEDGAVASALSAVTAASPARADGRPVVCDSKKLCSGRRGVERLERNLMPFVAAGDAVADRSPAKYQRLFAEAAGPSKGAAASYPWYAEQSLEVPRCGEAAGIMRDAARLREGLRAKGVRFAGLWFEPLQPAEFNAAVRRTGNKSLVLFDMLGRILKRLWARAGEAPVEAWIDKQGGRNRYAPLLLPLFGGAWISRSAEGPDRSIYGIREGRRRMTVRFLRNGESRHQAIALASMCSKYVRELFMARFNTYWQRRVDGLAPTRGYPQDAARFVSEIDECRRREGVPDDVLIRCR